jgi:DNA repair protein SbcC/Rad50
MNDCATVTVGSRRGLHILSGGERSLASLAPALRLAQMSTARGTRFEGLFIDEGLGALGPESLGQALTLLEHLHAGGQRLIVISHVEELKERIAAKFEVTPTGPATREVGGSRFRFICVPLYRLRSDIHD